MIKTLLILFLFSVFLISCDINSDSKSIKNSDNVIGCDSSDGISQCKIN